MSRMLPLSLLAGAALAILPGLTAAEAPRVVTSVKPVHSLVAGVMGDTGEPRLILDGAASPHRYSLRPSDARALQEAQIIFWIGPMLEASLVEPLETLSPDARVVALHAAEGVDLLGFREGGSWEMHDEEHQEGGHRGEHHEEHHGEHHDEHRRERQGEHYKGHHEEHHGAEAHAHGGNDMHVWLDPANARAMVEHIAAELADVDPDRAGHYRRNAEALASRIESVDAEIAEKLSEVRSMRYIVFHDAYQYFERHYGLNPVGPITVSPERAPGAARLREIQARIEETGAVCVFAEPQFEPRLVETVVEGSGARIGSLDPLGAAYEAGADLYFDVMRGLAEGLRDCLGKG